MDYKGFCVVLRDFEWFMGVEGSLGDFKEL